MKRYMYALIALVALAGCAENRAVSRMPPLPEAYPTVRTRDELEPGIKSTSLWRPSSDMTRAYDDHRARVVGDLVTVIVSESSEASREASTNLSRDAKVDVGVNAFLGAPAHLGLADVYAGGGDFSPSIGASSANSFKGGGSTKRKESLKTMVAARVLDVLPDGNLLVEGRRQVTVNDEVQFLHVRGIARPVDISPNNTISSAALAEADIIYDGTGAISSEQKPGWMYRLISALWPF